MSKHVCANRFFGEGARGGCYFKVENAVGYGKEDKAHLDVGWSCVVVHDAEIPITWLSEIIAIATAHKGGIAGFLKDHNYGGGYALICDAPKSLSPPHDNAAE